MKASSCSTRAGPSLPLGHAPPTVACKKSLALSAFYPLRSPSPSLPLSVSLPLSLSFSLSPSLPPACSRYVDPVFQTSDAAQRIRMRSLFVHDFWMRHKHVLPGGSLSSHGCRVRLLTASDGPLAVCPECDTVERYFATVSCEPPAGCFMTLRFKPETCPEHRRASA